MKPDAQEIIGMLMIPFFYLVITFYIAYSTGRKFDKEWAGMGWKSHTAKRMKTWGQGALATVSFILIAPFTNTIYEVLEKTVLMLPVFLQLIVTLIGVVMAVYLLLTAVMCIGLCLIAADKYGP